MGPPITLSAFDGVWTFNETGAAPGADWAKTIYTAGTNSWKSGPGVFAFGSNPLPVDVGTVLTEPDDSVVSHYFQRKFTFSGDPARTALRLTTLIDDGAVVFLNGNEVAQNQHAGRYGEQYHPSLGVGRNRSTVSSFESARRTTLFRVKTYSVSRHTRVLKLPGAVLRSLSKGAQWTPRTISRLPRRGVWRLRRI